MIGGSSLSRRPLPCTGFNDRRDFRRLIPLLPIVEVSHPVTPPGALEHLPEAYPCRVPVIRTVSKFMTNEPP
jgi:hypothetical protein